MIDIQSGLGLKHIPQLIRRKMCGCYNCKYARSDIMEKVIKNCREVKKRNDGVNRIEKKNQREDFRILLGIIESGIYQSKEYSTLLKIKKV